MDNISIPVRRIDFDEKIAGKAKYTQDLHFEHMLYAKTLRSEFPCAKINSIEIPEIPKGYFIVDSKDIPHKNIVPIVYDDQPFFAEDKVNYVGEPILLVVGPDKTIILNILKNIKVNYTVLKPILNIKESEKLNKICAEYEITKGDFDSAVKNYSYIVEDEFNTGYQEHIYLETQSMIGHYDGDCVTVYGSMQCPYFIHNSLKQALNYSDDAIRVVQLPTGGAFGGKEEYPSLIGVHAALASIKAKKPVQLVFDRQEDIICSTKRHPSIINIKSYINDENIIVAREINIKIDAGAYAGLSNVVLQRIAFASSGAYNIPNLKIHAVAFFTNNIVTGAFRGFGGCQAIFAIEMHMENIANKLNMDSLELKNKYFLKKGDSSSTSGLFNYDIKLNQIAERIEQMSLYNKKREKFKENTEKLQGIGISIIMHGCGFTGNGEKSVIHTKARLKKNKDNTIEIYTAAAEMGQGVLTTLRKIVATTLDIPIENIKINYPDTLICPDSGPTVASRTIMIVGKLLKDIAEEMKKRWAEEEFEIIKEYKYPQNLSWDNDNLKGNANPEYSWGANAVEVEIDPITYESTIKGIWAVYDIGNAIDERIAKGQIEGGIIQGLGYGKLEVLQVKDGFIQQCNLTNYIIPSSTDFPKIESELISNPFDEGPFGARGMGELTIVGAAPAYALAVQNALNKKISRIPVTQEYIMELMNDKN
ncbi:MAG: xanthine dehydrogenase, molybdenum binding subunit apoprotein [Bacillota bacterium]|nr:xanthine dehydrogenase, molybdenum binding subunit apoprotein [Bacillota bacterium]